MKKLLAIVLLGVALVFGGCGGGGLHSKDAIHDHIAGLQAQIDGLQQQVWQLASGDNVVNVDNTTIANISSQIAELERTLEDLKGQIGTDVDTDESIEEALTRLEGRIDDLETTVSNLQITIDNLLDRPVGGPAYVFSGAGEPGEIEGAQAGDFYISTTSIHQGNGFGYIIYLNTEAGWVEFGLIKVGSGEAVEPPEPARLERF